MRMRMRMTMAYSLGILTVFCNAATASASGINYYNDFEQYATLSGIDGVDGWISQSPTYGGISCWRVSNASDPGGLSGVTCGNYLERGDWGSAQGEDWATLHLASIEPIARLNIQFNYILQGNEMVRIDISGDGTIWNDMTTVFGVANCGYTNGITTVATANLSSNLAATGITTDIFLRFTAWNPTGNGDWHMFAIDNLSITAIPEPSPFFLLGIGVASVLGYVWRRKRAA